MIGILEAKKRYKPEKGAEFATYSSYWIRKRIQEAVRNKLNSEKLFLSDDDIEAGISSITEESGTTEKPSHIGRDLLGLLTSLEKEIIKLYFEEKKTLLEIGDLLEISRQRVKQLKQKAMRKIKVNNVSKECE